jgi:hypothetical protein
MPRKLPLLLIPLTLVTLFGFSNCGSYEPSLVSLKDLSSQTCVAQTKLEIAADFSSSLCDDVSNFACERRIFRPGAISTQSTETECFSIGRKSDVCVQVAKNSYDTEAARDGADPKEFEEGGEFNREEIQCWNTKVQRQSIALIQADANSLSQALNLSIERCYARGAQ